MNYIIDERIDLDILRQSDKQLFSKIELLDRNMKIIDNLEGNLISDSYSINAESDIRRTYSCELFVKNSSFFIGVDKKIWIDRIIRPYVGIRHQRSQEVIWYLMGTFRFNDMNYTYDVVTRTLSLSCSDLMCTLNGDRGGYIEGFSNVIEGVNLSKGVLIDTVLRTILHDANITRYRITGYTSTHTLPYDLTFSVGSTYHQMLKEVLDLYAGFEMFFDLYGEMVIQPIPTTENEISILDETIINPLVISEQMSNSFNNIYNVTQIWGNIIEADRYTQIVTCPNGLNYNATFVDLTELINHEKYGIRIPVTCGSNPTLNINGLGTFPINDDDGTPVDIGKLLANTDYVVKFRLANSDYVLLGQYQAYGEYICTDTDCPFSTTNLGYQIKQVLEYSELESDSLCLQRAKYDTWLATRMKDTINLTIMVIPFLDVNWKISYNSLTSGITGEYIIKSISGSTNEGTMSISMIKYSPLYPDIIPNTK